MEEQKLISKISNGRVEAAADLYYITILTALLMRNTTRINEHSPNRKKPCILNYKVTAREKKKKKKSYLDFNYSYLNLDSSKLIAQLQDGTVSTGWRRKLILPEKGRWRLFGLGISCLGCSGCCAITDTRLRERRFLQSL